MKKLVGFCVFVVIIFLLFLLFSRRAKDYNIQYNNFNYEIYEEFEKDKNEYYFTLKKDNVDFDFVINHKYSTKRKVISKVDEKEKDGYLCLSIKVFDYESPYVCYKDNNYVDGYSLGVSENNSNKEEIKNVEKITVFNDEYDYYIWNGYGISNILEEKDYNFLKKESYDNPLSYKMGKYLIFADYDSTREFNKFYIFNNETKKISSWDLAVNISFNSYFMGDVENYIYIFDKKNKIQYKLNVEKETVSTTSDNEGALYYDNGWDTIGINKLVYNDVYFKGTNMINYTIDDGKVYYNYRTSNNNVNFDKDDISAYVDVQDSNAFYLKKDTLYRYNVDTGKTMLLKYFEWNFSYSNKIFIF